MYEVIVNYKIMHGFLKFVLKSSEPALAHSLPVQVRVLQRRILRAIN